MLGPPDGRYLARRPDREDDLDVIVFRTLGARRRRLRPGRRAQALQPGEAEPAPVPVSRVTVIRAEAFAGEAEAAAWVEEIGGRAAAERAGGRAAEALALLNNAIHAHRAAAGDPYAVEATRAEALATRLGFGSGDQLAEGRFEAAVELGRPRVPRARRAQVLSPQERLAGILGGRERVLAAEDLVLRARLDLDQGRPRQAALQADAALEALIAELEPEAANRPALGRELETLREARPAVTRAAAAARAGEPGEQPVAAVEQATGAMERALRRRRYGGDER